LKDPRTSVSAKGPNPFDYVSLNNGKKLSAYVPTYDAGVDAYNWIAKYIDRS
jgi:hypothetical protein